MGKGGGALSTWIREFCTLVFIQTIQAFTYAIIIAVIAKLQFANVIESSTKSSAMGLFVVIALVSVFKIEDLLRKIFGISPTKADHHGAVKSIAKLAFAGHLGKRVLNNVGKVTGGVGAKIKSRKDLKKLNDEREKDINAMRKDVEKKPDSEPTSTELMHKAMDAKANGDMDGYLKLREQAVGAKKAEKAGTSASASGNGSSNINQKIRAMEKEYDQKKDEIMKARKEATKQIAKGFTETGGALIGGTMGGIIGIADGDLDDAITGVLGGAGIGDMIGEKSVDAIAGLNKQMSNAINATKGSMNRIKTNRKLKAEGKPTIPMSTMSRELRRFDQNREAYAEIQRQLSRQNSIDDM